jgi:IS30 family transposase
MRDWKQVHIDAGIEVFLCDPHAPWQRGSNENTNGLLRQCFPKGTDFATVTEADLDAVADELNDRPRKRSAFANPTEQRSQLLLQ